MTEVAVKPSLGRISLRLDLMPGQTVPSLISALAAHNGIGSSDRFNLAMGLDGSGLRRGDPDAIANLARVTRVPALALERALVVRSGSGFRVAGQQIAWSELRRETFVCPDCIEEDHAARPHLRWEVAARGQPQWGHRHLVSCPRHDLELVALPSIESRSVLKGDLAAQLKRARAAGLPLSRIDRPADALDRFIDARFKGEDQTCIKGVALGDALFLGFYLGAPHLDARALPPPKDMEERRDWILRGVEIASDGEAAIEARLRQISGIVNPYGACEIGLKRVFGSLYDRMSKCVGEDMLLVRTALVRIGIEQFLFAFEETEALGMPLPVRSKQTLESARRRFGISDREFRATLIELELLERDQHHSPGNQVLVDFSETAGLLDKLNGCLNLLAAANALGLMPGQLVKLCDRKIIEPFFVRPSRDLKPLRYFRKESLQHFVGSLAATSRRDRQRTDLVDIFEAALKCCRQPADVIAAIADGRISRTFRTGRIRNLRDIRLDVEEVRHGTRDIDDEDLVSADDCATLLKTNILSVRKIIRNGIIEAAASSNPVNRRKQLAVKRDDLITFNKTYASLNALGLEWGTTPSAMGAALIRLGLRIAFPTETVGCKIYKRAEVRRVSGKLQERLDHIEVGREVARRRR